MAHFSFGKFFGKNSRSPRFAPTHADEAAEAAESLPVGRLVSFTDHGPEDAPLFQELEAPSSPFVVVGGARPSMVAGGLPGPSRTAVEDGFTADDLASLVPSHCVRAGAVPGSQVIPLPQQVLRASLGAGQPAVLLSQLHQACPELFVAPSSLDQDLVIALPPQKVQRMVARAEATGSSAGAGAIAPPPRPASIPLDSMGWTMPDNPLAEEEAAAQAFAATPSKIKLPPPRRKFDEIQGTDLRPLVEKPAPMILGGPFMELGSAAVSGHTDAGAIGFPSPFLKGETAVLPAAASPFQVTSALPYGQPSRGGLPKRFESPFAIVSPGEVPSVLESPFARHPVTGFDVPPVPPSGPLLDLMPEPVPEPASTVSLRLSALLQGQSTVSLGFAPERVPASVRVTLATAPLLAQVASGRIRVSLVEVVAGLDSKFQPAFKEAQTGLDLHVPLRELFDNLPEAAPPTPVAPPVNSAFETPFSVRAEEDKPLTAVNSPFQLVASAPAGPTLPAAPPLLAEALPFLAAPPPLPIRPEVSAAVPAALVPDFAVPPGLPEVERTAASHEPPFVVIPEPSAALPQAAPTAPRSEFTAPSAASPFLLVPDETATVLPLEKPTLPPVVIPPVLIASAPAPLAPLAPLAPPAGPPPLLTPAAPTPPDTAPLARPPAQIALPPLRNPFALAPGEGVRAGFGLDMPLMPYDDEPVPLESLREDESMYRSAPAAAAPPVPGNPSASAEAAAPAPAAEPEAPAAPPAIALPPVVRLALSEQEPLPPPGVEKFVNPSVEAAAPAALLVPESLIEDPMSPPATDPTAMDSPVELAPASSMSRPEVVTSPFLEAGALPLPPLPFELLSSVPSAAPAAATPTPSAPDTSPLITPALAQARPFTVNSPAPTADDRAAFASVFAPSALANPLDGTSLPLGEMDTLPAIALAKLPSLGEEAPPVRRPIPPADAPAPASPGFSFGSLAPPEPLPPVVSASPAPEPAPALPLSHPPSPALEATTPPLWDPASTLTAAADFSSTIEDLSFGYVDNPTQLALRAVFATDRTLATQDVVNLSAALDGLRACLVHTPHASLHSAAGPNDTEDVRHFRDRAGALFEKTASLVRELDPSAREQSFTLRTGKSVVSFFAVEDVCLAVLHAEPSFRPGVREKLTLVARSVAEMLTA